MGFLKKLFKAGSTSLPNGPAKDPAKDPNMIRVFDGYGRALFISKDEWRRNVLPGSIRSNWDKPNELYSIIVGALNDEFRSDVVDAAKQLYKIDPDRSRAACLLGVVLMEENRLDDAEKIFRRFIEEHGDDGLILSNLAKVYSRRKESARSEELLWHALEVDPNQENGVGWYWMLHKERGGDAAGLTALRRVAALPKSWRAHLWLAREALTARDLAAALQFYEQSLAAAPTPVPTDLLTQMSGDLGNTGHLPEILNLVLPRFDLSVHGLQVGNNLIKAMLDLGQLDAARKLVQELYAQNRLDWKETLDFWDTELAKARVETTLTPVGEKLQISLVPIDGPIWLPPSSPAVSLFPAAPLDATRLSFLGSSAETTHAGDITPQLSDWPGRSSRALPLFFSEQVCLRSDAQTRTLVPWIKAGGFVLAGLQWADEDAAAYARHEPASDYLVLSHLKARADPWTIELRIIRTIDAKCLATIERSFPFAEVGDAARHVAGDLLSLLSQHAQVKVTAAPREYVLPEDLSQYLLRLEQLLATRCSTMQEVADGFLSGEHAIVDGNITFAVANPRNSMTRFILLETLLALKKVRPEIIKEYRGKLELLQREHPLPGPAGEACTILLQQAIA
jgi:tetratricopeptide (TPR) repeat protein